MSEVIVVKMGGAAFGGRDTTVTDIVHLQEQGRQMVIVHGGGSLITGWLARQGVATCFIRGERVTDLPTLEVVTAVLSGLANKEIVAAINSSGGRAVGISGVDGALIRGRITDSELGYVGSVEKVDTALLEALLQAGYVPVVSPVSLNSAGGTAGAPQLLNVNGDPAAGEIAAAIGAERLIFLSDVAGVLDRSGALLPRLSSAEAEALLASGVASGGMIPKVKACLRALEVARTAHIIDGTQPHALLKEIEGHGVGTTIYR
ncbi:MAG: acetylglutamate kinase [Chloroflexota bacterium]